MRKAGDVVCVDHKAMNTELFAAMSFAALDESQREAIEKKVLDMADDEFTMKAVLRAAI